MVLPGAKKSIKTNDDKANKAEGVGGRADTKPAEGARK
jgi:hypothetical protein